MPTSDYERRAKKKRIVLSAAITVGVILVGVALFGAFLHSKTLQIIWICNTTVLGLCLYFLRENSQTLQKPAISVSDLERQRKKNRSSLVVFASMGIMLAGIAVIGAQSYNRVFILIWGVGVSVAGLFLSNRVRK